MEQLFPIDGVSGIRGRAGLVVTPPTAVHPLAAVETTLDALSDADETRTVRRTGSPVGVQSEGAMVQCWSITHEPSLSKTLL